MAAPMIELVAVICTYDNPVLLDRVLSALGEQRADPHRWGVLVVNNNSGPATDEVLARHVATATVADLRVVVEAVQGLTPARQRGVAETTAPWIAFVDDDCLLDVHWMEAALDFIEAHPDAGGFGGRVVPVYLGVERPALAGRGWVFAEQDLAAEAMAVECLVGAGMVVNRQALAASGWIREPFFADRIGHQLVSGGDVEIALRVAGTGRRLWYEPGCRLQHLIPAERTTMAYLLRMTRGLGTSSALADALVWHSSRPKWAGASARAMGRSSVALARSLVRGWRTGDGRRDTALTASYEWGRWVAIVRIATRLARGRYEYFGRDRAVRAG